jgi:hypothetical protein
MIENGLFIQGMLIKFFASVVRSSSLAQAGVQAP